MCITLTIPNSIPRAIFRVAPDAIRVNFAADVMKRNKQLILLPSESVTSYTVAQIIPDEKSDILRDTLIQLCMELHPLDRPNTVIRVDPAPGFRAMREDKTLDHFSISIEVGSVKNPNKNPVSEIAISELENKLLKQEPGGGPASPFRLSIVLARLN